MSVTGSKQGGGAGFAGTLMMVGGGAGAGTLMMVGGSGGGAFSRTTMVIGFSGFTGGEDGISLSMPGIFAVSSSMGEFLGTEITGRVVTYYFILIVCLGLFLGMLRFTYSPLGRVLQAIRDNVQRAEALGYKTFIFQTVSISYGCTVATVIGGLLVLFLVGELAFPH